MAVSGPKMTCYLSSQKGKQILRLACHTSKNSVDKKTRNPKQFRQFILTILITLVLLPHLGFGANLMDAAHIRWCFRQEH